MPSLDPRSLPQHADRLYRAAWALCGSASDAEDLVQETFARVLARPRTLRSGDDAQAYLMRALRNTFLTQRRHASRRPKPAALSVEELEPVDERRGQRPEHAAEAREVLATIASLAEHHRLALVAVDIMGLSYREAARILHTREATIATRVFRARERVAAELLGERPSAASAERPARAEEHASGSLSRRDAPRTLPAADAHGEDAPPRGSHPGRGIA